MFESQSKIITEKHKENFLSYVSKLPNCGQLITDINFIESNPSFYLFYPKLFSPVFGVNDFDVEKLCLAGYLFYQSTMFLDAVIDDNDNSKLMSSMICQEEAIKLLTSIFGLNSSYWHLWNVRREEYLEAVYIDNSLSKTDDRVSINAYGNLADFKSSFGKAAIDALYVLGGEIDKSIYRSLLDSHKYFSIAFQINDDVLDFKEDFTNGQFNWAVHIMSSQMKKGIDIDKLKKLFYIRGEAKKLFAKAISYLNEALREVENINVPLWVSEIDRLKSKFKKSIIEIDNYLEILNSEISLSKKIKIQNPIMTCISDAISFINKMQNDNGSWREYINQGGISDVWSTVFICSKLSESDFLKLELSNNLKTALNFIKNYCCPIKKASKIDAFFV